MNRSASTQCTMRMNFSSRSSFLFRESSPFFAVSTVFIACIDGWVVSWPRGWWQPNSRRGRASRDEDVDFDPKTRTHTHTHTHTHVRVKGQVSLDCEAANPSTNWNMISFRFCGRLSTSLLRGSALPPPARAPSPRRY